MAIVQLEFRVIKDNDVDEQFQEAALSVDALVAAAIKAQGSGAQCASEALVEGTETLQRVCAKVEAYFTLRLRSLGRKVLNLNALQQHVYLRSAPLFAILEKYDAGKAEAFLREYIPTARGYYYGCYQDALRQFSFPKIVPLPPTPLVGHLPYVNALSRLGGRLKGAFGGSTAVVGARPEDGRGTGASDPSPSEPPSSSLASCSELVSGGTAIAHLLLDLIRREEDFATRFFGLDQEERQGAYLDAIFAHPTESFLRRLKSKLGVAANVVEVVQLYDRFCELLLTSGGETCFSSRSMQKYIDYLASRVQTLLGNQAQSLETATVASASTRNGSSQIVVSLVTRKFASLLLEVSLACGLGVKAEQLKGMLDTTLMALEKFLARGAAALRDARSQSIYLINNYDYLMTFLEDRVGSFQGGTVLLADLIHGYDGRLGQIVDGFVVEELRPHFASLYEFLACHERGSSIAELTPLIGPIIVDFNDNVSARIREINASLIQAFSDHRTAIFVINVVFSQLLSAYQQFLETHDQIVGKAHQEGDQPMPMSIAKVEQVLRQFHSAFTPTTTVISGPARHDRGIK